jgi:hypothetical protein
MNLLELLRCYQDELINYDRETAKRAMKELGVDPILIKAIIASFDDAGHSVDGVNARATYKFEWGHPLLSYDSPT